jgi:hypothetical protein
MDRILNVRLKFDEYFEKEYEEYKRTYNRDDKEPAQDSAMTCLGAFPDSKAMLERLWEANNTVKASLQEADDAAGAILRIPDQDSIVGSPERPEGVVSRPAKGIATSMKRENVDAAVVDNWNEVALKNLGLGGKTRFYEIGDLVIIDALRDHQPYVAWAKQQPGINAEARITLTKKGGAFDPGELMASGVSNRAAVEAAIKRVSKKKVQFS